MGKPGRHALAKYMCPHPTLLVILNLRHLKGTQFSADQQTLAPEAGPVLLTPPKYRPRGRDAVMALPQTSTTCRELLVFKKPLQSVMVTSEATALVFFFGGPPGG